MLLPQDVVVALKMATGRAVHVSRGHSLYRSAGHYPLGMIGTEHWMPFIRERFEQVDRAIKDRIIRNLCGQTEGRPFYAQHLAHALWEITPSGKKATPDRLSEAIDVLLRRESTAYAALWDTFSQSQQRLLRGLASEGDDAQPFSNVFIQAHGLGAPSSAQRAVEALQARDVLDRDNGTVIITDRFFRLWIRRL